MLGQGVEVGALFGLRPEDAQGVKGRAARGRQRCCRASGGCADCRRSGRRAQEERSFLGRGWCGEGQPLSPLRGQLPLYRGAKETATEASPVYPSHQRAEGGVVRRGRWHSEAVTEELLSPQYPIKEAPPQAAFCFYCNMGSGDLFRGTEFD